MDKIYLFVSPYNSMMVVTAKSEDAARAMLKDVLSQHECSVPIKQWKIMKIGAELSTGVYGLV